MGLPGLLCAKLGASQVLLTDYEPVVVDHLRRNAEQNGVAPRCSFLALDWFDRAPLAPAQRHAYHLLLLADVIYAAAVVQPLVATLRALLRPDSGGWVARWRERRAGGRECLAGTVQWSLQAAVALGLCLYLLLHPCCAFLGLLGR